MRIKPFFRIWILLITFILFFCFSSNTKAQNLNSDKRPQILDNSCQIPFELKLEKSGILFLLLEPQYFQPTKLKNLFLCLSEKRSKLIFLQITAYSDEKALDTDIKKFLKPNVYEERSHSVIIFPPNYLPIPPSPPYYRAYYYRYENEYFEYSPNPKEWKLLAVIMSKKVLKK